MKEKIRKLKTIYKSLTLKEITIEKKQPGSKVISSTMAGARKSSTHKRPVSSGMGTNKVKPYVKFKFKLFIDTGSFLASACSPRRRAKNLARQKLERNT